eukprot:COSAG02_NODE_327_length_24561_cov_92.867754_5_plen_789_part_00
MAATMSLPEFVATLAAFGVAESDAKRYFRVFDQQRTGSLDYREFVVGLVLMDKNTHHGGLLAEQRSLRIFRLYDEDEDGYLSRSELENLVAQLRSRRRESVSRADVVSNAEEILRLANPVYAQLRAVSSRAVSQEEGREAASNGSPVVNLSANLEGGAPLGSQAHTEQNEASQMSGVDTRIPAGAVEASAYEQVSQKQFLQAVGDLKVRGTSQLFRLSCPILSARWNAAGGNRQLEVQSDTVARSRSLAAAVPVDWARSRAGATFSSSAALLSRVSSDSQSSEELVISGLEIAHKVIGHLLLDDGYKPPPPRTAFTLLDGPDWLALINCVQNLVQKETCCVEVPVPAKVFGDIHGQITELRALFSAYGSPNHRTGDINGFQYVFTGDFVDRGPHSLEVLALLLSLKVAYPTSVFLIRGNHEDRALNEFYGFCDECTTRLRAPPSPRRDRRSRDGNDDEQQHENLDNIATQPGRVVWQASNEMFEYLPLAARIGERILALHGGVGRTLNSIDQINALQRPLCIDHGINDEEEVSQRSQDPPDGTVSPVLGSGALNRAQADPLQHLLMDILWSDPSANDTVLGVAPNLVRGGATLTYGPDRVRRFCNQNQIDLLIRAHECVGDGYQWFAGGRCVTVFSAANYCGVYENDGALLEIDRHLTVLPKVLKARPLQVQPPNTELPDSESSENDEAGEDDWHDLEHVGSGSLPATEQDPQSTDARSGRGRKRERPRGIAGPRGAEPASAATKAAATNPDTRGREPRESKRRRHGPGDASVVDRTAVTKSGFRPKR